MPVNLPERIVRILSFHGPVDLWVGAGEVASTIRVHVAPFDDEVIAFVPVGSLAEDGLLVTARARMTAKADDRSYTLQLEGRAMAGRPVAGHPRRSSLEPWLPEGAHPTRLLAVSFTPLEVELVEDDGQVKNRYAGPTPAGKAASGHARDLLATALGGHGRWLAVTTLVGTFAWFGFLGADHPWRPVALILSWVGGLGLLGGVRMLGQAAAFHRWREGTGTLDRAPTIRDGLVAPGEVRRAGLISLVVGTLATLLGTLWPHGWGTVLVVIVTTGLPIVGASWWLHSVVAARGLERD